MAENQLPPYEENPIFMMLAQSYTKSMLKSQLSFFEYCQLHLKADEISLIDHFIRVFEGEDDFEDDQK